MSNIEHWTAEDREALVMTTLGGASELPVHELVRRITKSGTFRAATLRGP
jgi:hypothetical protein